MQVCRPVRAKAFKYQAIYKAFALTGRFADSDYTQGVALGWELLGLQPVLEPLAKVLLRRNKEGGELKKMLFLFVKFEFCCTFALPIYK